MNTNTPFLSCALTFTLGLGLVLATGLETVELAPPAAPAPAVERNGAVLDGITLQDPFMQATYVDAGGLVPMTGWLDGHELHGIKANESGFVASMELSTGTVQLRGTELVGAQLIFGLPHTTPSDINWIKVVVDIVDIERIDDDVLAHHVVVYDVATSAWVDPCPSNGGLGLIPLAGAWDFSSGDALGGDRVTLACRGDVLAKCVEWGYQPWHSDELADLHQACTRMARADYCGDGTPMTIEGTPIDVYDSLGIQQQATDWAAEAEWGPDGATCISDGALRLDLLGIAEPDCLTKLLRKGCGHLKGDAQLANGYAG